MRITSLNTTWDVFGLGGFVSKAAGAVITLLVFFLSYTPCWAIDGRVEVRGNHQDGGAGDTAYKTSTLWENYSLGQRVLFSKNFILQLDLVTRRQQLESQSVLSKSNTREVSFLPNASRASSPGLKL